MTQPHLLPSNSTPWETAVGSTSAQRYPLDPSLLARFRDPWACPAPLLPWLAYQVGLDLWFDDWAEDKKRRAIANARRLATLKGTVAGIRGYLDLVDVPLVSATLPPQHGYLAAPLTDAQRAAWLARMSQLRIFRFRDSEGVRPGEGFADGNALADDLDGATAAGVDRAPLFDGEQAFLYRNGSEIALQIASVIGSTYQIALPGTVSDAAVADGDSFSYTLPGTAAVSGFLTLGLDPQNSYQLGGLEITPIKPSLTPIDTRFELVAEAVAVDEGDAFADGNALCDDSYAAVDTAYLYMFRRIYLLDPDQPASAGAGGFVADGFLLGIPPHTGIIKIDVSEPLTPHAAVSDGGRGFLLPPTSQKLDRALEAVACAQGGTDVIVVDTVTFSPITFGDRVSLDGSIQFGQMTQRS